MVNKMRNKVYIKHNKFFISACQRMGVKPTTRQASKFRRKTGIVYKTVVLNKK